MGIIVASPVARVLRTKLEFHCDVLTILSGAASVHIYAVLSKLEHHPVLFFDTLFWAVGHEPLVRLDQRHRWGE